MIQSWIMAPNARLPSFRERLLSLAAEYENVLAERDELLKAAADVEENQASDVDNRSNGVVLDKVNLADSILKAKSTSESVDSLGKIIVSKPPLSVDSLGKLLMEEGGSLDSCAKLCPAKDGPKDAVEVPTLRTLENRALSPVFGRGQSSSDKLPVVAEGDCDPNGMTLPSLSSDVATPLPLALTEEVSMESSTAGLVLTPISRRAPERSEITVQTEDSLPALSPFGILPAQPARASQQSQTQSQSLIAIAIEQSDEVALEEDAMRRKPLERQTSQCEATTSTPTARSLRKEGFVLRRCWARADKDVLRYWGDIIYFGDRPAFMNRNLTMGGTPLRRQVTKSLHAVVDGGEAGCCILHPTGIPRVIWNFLCVFFILYDFLMMPMTAFELDETAQELHKLVDFAVAIFWTIDVLVSFRTAYFVGTRLEVSARSIAINYAMSNMLIDMCIVVVEWASFVHDLGSIAILKGTRTLRTLKVLKLLRIVRLRKVFQALSEHLQSGSIQLLASLSMLTLCVAAAIHLFTCFWYALGASASDGWPSYDGYQGRKDTFFWYVASARWALAQFNGRTDENDRRTLEERGFTCFTGVVLGVVGRAVYTSVLTKTMLDLSDMHSGKAKKRRCVLAFLEQYHISSETATTVKRFLREHQELGAVNKMAEDEETVMQLLPRHVQADVLCEIRFPTLSKLALVELLCQMCEPAVRDVCHRAVRTVTSVTDEIIFDRGDACTTLRILHLNAQMCYGQPIAGECPSRGGPVGPKRGSSFYRQMGLEQTVLLREGRVVCEAALFLDWKVQGRLVSTGISTCFQVEALQLAETLATHKDAYTVATLYGKRLESHVAQLFTQYDAPNDITDFQLSMYLPPDFAGRCMDVTIVGATGLRTSDCSSNYASAYAVVAVVGGRIVDEDAYFRTHTVRSTSTPAWNFSEELAIGFDQSIEIQVWDETDLDKEDKLMGIARLRAAELFDVKEFRGQLQLTGGQVSKTAISIEDLQVSGQVEVRIRWRSP
eukprot:TRINITY_DN59194_c0_g2_i2.p1 TRINITY_DN59194_c0_g2~~TRINITY_DN59194_c0_g2_i2.p1  ORF type:complete len:1004 (+),score=188.96 TRINITY_DN59194_c0_g2_i2:139-3150(+)